MNYELAALRAENERLARERDEANHKLALIGAISHDEDGDTLEKRSRRLGQCAHISFTEGSLEFAIQAAAETGVQTIADYYATIQEQQDEIARLRKVASMADIQSCNDHGCIYGHPGGMGTNGGCKCLYELPLDKRRRAETNIRTLRAELERAKAERDAAVALMDAGARTPPQGEV